MEHDTVLVVDFGAQYAQLIARRVREEGVYSEIVPHTITAAELAARAPAGVIFSGGPKSVHVEGAPSIDAAVYDLGVPILGICYGAQLVAQQLGGEVARTGRGEYGRTAAERHRRAEPPDRRRPAGVDEPLRLDRAGAGRLRRHRPHARGRRSPSSSTRAGASTASSSTPRWPTRRGGQEVLRRFLFDVCGCRATWTMASVIDDGVARVRAQVGAERAICGLSGGVDSSVAAALVHRAIGPQLTCVYVDTGLMRKGESEQVVETFRRHLGIELIHVDAGDRFFERLEGVLDPEEKRKAIGELFIRVFEANTGGLTDARFLVQGTLYPDVIESGTAHAATIKSHHNVGGLPEDMTLELVEPLRSLFKDEVRRVGHRARAARRDRLAPAVPGPRSRRAHHRRGHPGEGGAAAGGRRHRAGGDPRWPASSGRSGRPSPSCPTSARSG